MRRGRVAMGMVLLAFASWASGSLLLAAGGTALLLGVFVFFPELRAR
jgi:Na+/proline symporter